jgi:sentrin-specific protease 7
LKQQNNAESTPGNPQAAAHVDKLERSGRGIRDPRHSKVQNSAEHNVHSSTDDEFSSEVEKLSSCSRNGENGATLEHENSHNANLTRVNRSSGEQSISDRSTPRSYRTERARGIPKTVDNDFIMKEMADTEISNENRWSQLHPEWSDQWKETIFYQGKDNAKATVQKDDVERLDEGVFLNDNLIEFYLRWLENRLEQQNPEIAKRIYLHNTFFFKRLTQNGKGRAINYNAVERWTNKVELLSFDYIIVPVHENTHWYVAVICNAASLLHAPSDTSEQPTLGKSNPRLRNEPSIIEILDSQDSVQELDGVMDLDGDAKFGSLSHISLHAPVSTVDPSLDRMNLDTDSESPPKKSEATMSRLIDTTQTRILTLDSMGGRHSPTCTKLRDYLVEEITAKKGVRISPPAALGLTVRNLPRQQNDYDCGIFLLNYVEEFLNDPDGFYRKVLEGQSLDVTFRDASETRAILRNIILSMQR